MHSVGEFFTKAREAILCGKLAAMRAELAARMSSQAGGTS